MVVTAVNADGQASATSAATDVVSGGDAPVVKTKPSISGSAVVGEELTADNGTWTGGAVSFTFQWQRCDSVGNGCVDVTNATARSYGVRTRDAGHRMRVAVTAKNASSSSTATSDATARRPLDVRPTPTADAGDEQGADDQVPLAAPCRRPRRRPLPRLRRRLQVA